MSIHYSEHHISGSFHGFFQKLKHMLKPDATSATSACASGRLPDPSRALATVLDRVRRAHAAVLNT